MALYTVPVKGGHVGHGKACPTEPEDIWHAVHVAHVTSGVYPDEAQALAAAEHKVRLEIDQLPPNWGPFTEPGGLSPSPG